nr:uncharacterized protein LOC110126936 isoform X2 [Odocoileus virginianus texanus]
MEIVSMETAIPTSWVFLSCGVTGLRVILTCKTNRHWVLGTSACCCSPQPLLCGGAGVGGLCRVRQPALETPRAHGGAGCVALGLKQGKGGNDLASRTGNGLRVPVPRAVEGAETRRDSPDPGAGLSTWAWGPVLTEMAEHPADVEEPAQDHARVASSYRRLSHLTANTPGSSALGKAALRSSSGAPQALPLASVSPSGLGSRLRKTLLVTTEGMQACTKGILRTLHGSLRMQRSQRHSSFRGIQSRKIKPRAMCGERGSPGFFLKPFPVPSTNQ